jgi:hypothetical protein
MQVNHGRVSLPRDPTIGSGGNPQVQYSTRGEPLESTKAEVRMDQTQNAQEGPANPDAACAPTFESAEVAQYYEDGVMERPAADVFDVLYSTGFAQE